MRREIMQGLEEKAAYRTAAYQESRHERDSISTAISQYFEERKQGANRDSMYTIFVDGKKPTHWAPHKEGDFDLYLFNMETALLHRAEYAAKDSTQMMFYRNAMRAMEEVSGQ